VELYEFVFAAVILARFLVPLLIPVYPIPGILASLLLDASDRAIYAQFVEIDVEAYQAYDKALDIYYLTLAYVATLRNWGHSTALRLARALWYYRLVGVALFELTGIRWILLVFPNVFEYFFIAFEVVRARWNPSRLQTRHLVIMAAVIWVFIKVPQEYWVHVAQQDTTDFIKVHLVGAPLEMPWVQVPFAYPWVLGAGLGLIVLLVLATRLVIRLLPASDRPLAFHADAWEGTPEGTALVGRPRGTARPSRIILLERIALVSLVAIIFGEVLPGWTASPLQVFTAVSVVIVLNAGVSMWLGRRGVEWKGAATEFLIMGAVNVGLVTAYGMASRRLDLEFDVGSALFFMGILTLIVTLHDRYLSLRRLRSAERSRPNELRPGAEGPG